MAKPKGEKIQPFRASNGQSLAHAQTSLRTSMRDLNLNQILAKSGLLLFYLFGFSKKKEKDFVSNFKTSSEVEKRLTS